MPIVDAHTFLSKSFDYLVVGGGTSGLVVAARFVSDSNRQTKLTTHRLSENPAVTVGVIEAGENHAGDPTVDIPGAYQ